MNLINQTKIKTRIIVLVLIPLVATLAFAVERLLDAREKLENVEHLEILQQYINVASPLIASLQQERLYSKLYMGPTTPDDPEGMEFKPQLQNSRAPVNTALSNYTAFIADRDKLSIFPALLTDIDAALEALEKLNFVRSLVDQRIKKQPIADDPKRKFWTYRSIVIMIQELNSSSRQVVLLASSNQELSLLASAYKNALYAKEMFMRQIANVYAGITRGMVPTTFAEMQRLQGLESSFVADFLNYAPQDVRSHFNETLGNQSFYKELNALYLDIRKKANNTINEHLKLDTQQWLATGNQVTNGYTAVIKNTLKRIESTKNTLVDDAQSVVNNTIIIIVVLIVVLFLVSAKIIASINTPLKQLIDDLTKLADSKDMTLRSDIKGKNELSLVGNAFNSLIETFGKTLASVREQIISMDDTTNNVANSINESMKLVDNQKEATESISVAINEMTATIYEVSEMSSTTSDTVKRAYDLSIESERDAKESKTSMDELFAELGDTSKIVTNLNDEASQISNILQVIKGISEQTNLLALNAAIEAARAGEMGRGFAVVADEVRELSKRTHDSTEQIQAQIETLINGAAAASKKMDALQENGQTAVETVERSTNAFITIKSELDQITDMATQIAVAAEEQTNVADEINKRIHLIKDDSDLMYQQGQNTLSSSQALQQNGQDLKDDIAVFRF